MRIEPAGKQDGLAMEAHVFEGASGCLVVPVPVNAETWAAMAKAQQSQLPARMATREQRAS